MSDWIDKGSPRGPRTLSEALKGSKTFQLKRKLDFTLPQRLLSTLQQLATLYKPTNDAEFLETLSFYFDSPVTETLLLTSLLPQFCLLSGYCCRIYAS